MVKKRTGSKGIGKIFALFTVVALAFTLTGCGIFSGLNKEKEEEKQILGFIDGYNPMIEEIQNILMRAGFDPGAIDGKMTWQTREALKEFQKANSLKKTGYVNTETRVKLDSYRIETEAQQAPLPGVPVEQAPPTLSIPAAQGETITADIIRQRLMLPEWVKKIQQALNDAGFAAGPADGKMGGKTKSALIEFQKSKGLTSDGVVGVRTWEELSKFFPSSSSGPAAVQMPQAEAVAGEVISSETIKERMRSVEWIKKVQEALSQAGFDPGPVDGKMGTKTKAAIMSFQKAKGLTPDGVIGKKTWEEISKYFMAQVTVPSAGPEDGQY